MDPNECLRLLLLAMDAGNADAIETHSDDLLAWLRAGGFPPVMRRSLPSYPRQPLIERRFHYLNRARTAALMTVNPNGAQDGFMIVTYDDGNERERFPLARPETEAVSA